MPLFMLNFNSPRPPFSWGVATVCSASKCTYACVIVCLSLKVTYAEVKPAQWDTYPSLQRPTITLTVEYTMDTQGFWDLCRAFFAVVIALTSLTAMWRLRNWNVRTNRYVQPGTTLVGNWRLCLYMPGAVFVCLSAYLSVCLSAFCPSHRLSMLSHRGNVSSYACFVLANTAKFCFSSTVEYWYDDSVASPLGWKSLQVSKKYEHDFFHPLEAWWDRIRIKMFNLGRNKATLGRAQPTPPPLYTNRGVHNCFIPAIVCLHPGCGR